MKNSLITLRHNGIKKLHSSMKRTATEAKKPTKKDPINPGQPTHVMKNETQHNKRLWGRKKGKKKKKASYLGGISTISFFLLIGLPAGGRNLKLGPLGKTFENLKSAREGGYEKGGKGYRGKENRRRSEQNTKNR